MLLSLTVAHDVLKWLHHDVVKYEMLLHSWLSIHACLQSSRFEFLPGDDCKYTSPLSGSQTDCVPATSHVKTAVVISKSKGDYVSAFRSADSQRSAHAFLRNENHVRCLAYHEDKPGAAVVVAGAAVDVGLPYLC